MSEVWFMLNQNQKWELLLKGHCVCRLTSERILSVLFFWLKNVVTNLLSWQILQRLSPFSIPTNILNSFFLPNKAIEVETLVWVDAWINVALRKKKCWCMIRCRPYKIFLKMEKFSWNEKANMKCLAHSRYYASADSFLSVCLTARGNFFPLNFHIDLSFPLVRRTQGFFFKARPINCVMFSFCKGVKKSCC